MKRKVFRGFLSVLAASSMLISCNKESIESDDLNGNDGDTSQEQTSVFVVATEIGDAVYLMTTETLESGTITAKNNGTEANAGSVWQYVNNKYLFSINEIGGSDPVDVRGYALDASSGRVSQIGYYSTTKYASWGSWGDKFAYTAYLSNSAETPNVDSDGTEYSPINIYYTVADPETGTAQFSNFSAEGFLLNSKIAEKDRSPETVNFPGFVEAGGKMYVSIATQGVSKYATLDANFETNMQNLLDNEGYGGTPADYVAKGSGICYTLAGSQAISGYQSTFSATGGVPFPLTPDKARIAVYDADSYAFGAEPEAFITTDAMGQAYGRYYGNPYNTMVTNGNYVYVFSPASARRYSDMDVVDQADGTEIVAQYSSTDNTEWNEETQLTDLRKATSSAKASVMRIRAGETNFDSSYGTVVLEDLLGGYTFTRVWHITEHLFLLRVMNSDKPTSEGYYYEFHKNVPTDARFAIYDAAAKSVHFISGLPTTAELRDDSSSIGEPCCTDTQVFIPMSLESQSLVYVVNNIDSDNPKATAGIKIEADIVQGVGILTTN
ncbi:MAG: DUF4374 domain-containing protein [Rikenellaceae bacterium]